MGTIDDVFPEDPFFNDDYPVDHRSCRLLGPTALVSTAQRTAPSVRTLTFYNCCGAIDRTSLDGCPGHLISCLQTA